MNEDRWRKWFERVVRAQMSADAEAIRPAWQPSSQWPPIPEVLHAKPPAAPQAVELWDGPEPVRTALRQLRPQAPLDAGSLLGLVALLLIADFVLALIGWISWAQAAAVAALVGGIVGFGFGWLSARRSTNELWLVATAVSSCLFALVVAQYLVTIAITPGECSPPERVTNCFD